MAEGIVAAAFLIGNIGRQLQMEGKLEWMGEWYMAILEPSLFTNYMVNKWTTPDSPTYKNETPQLTANPGTPVPHASGLCYLSGKIVRQNDFEEENFIKLIVDFGIGEWDEILAHFINDIDYDDLGPTIGGDNAIYEHLGTASQSGITNLFTEDACNYRNHVIVEYKLKKNDELKSISNITILARTKKYLEIGQDIGGTESYTRNPAQIEWDRYLKQKGKDYTNEMLPWVNDWTSLETYCAASLCDTDLNYYQVNVPMPSQSLVKATSTYRKWYPKYIVDPNIIVTGKANNASWWSSLNQYTNQRVNFDFGRKVVITRLEINNYHSEGSGTNAGIKNFDLQGSNTASDFDYVTYADGASGWTDVDTGLQAAQHAASDEADWEEIDIDNTTGYRYYSLKIADNWGATLHMGIKNLRFFTGNAASSCTGDETNIRYAFDFNTDMPIPANDLEKLIWQSFNGRIIRSQGAYKPVWEGAQEADGAGGLQTRASKHTFTVGTNTVEKTLKWNRIDKKNVFRITYRNSADRFKKCPDAVIKNEPDIAARGEETYSEECQWLIDTCLATRRAKLKYNKNWYADYVSSFIGFPDSQQLEIYDRAALTAAIPGWSGKDFLINVKIEDDYGRSQFVVEAYLSGNYQDQGFEIQPGYPTRTISPDTPPDEIDPDTVTVTNVTATAGNTYAVGSIRVQFTPPNMPLYSHTEIWVSTDDTNYYRAGQDSDGDAYLDGLGRLWDYGNTVYVKLQNVTVTGTRSAFPTAYDGSVAINATTKMAGFFAGQYDLWGGNSSISHADTKIVLGGLDGTPKQALGGTADSMTIDNYATYPGFYADGDGKFRAGGSGQFFKWSGSNISWQGTNTSLTEAGLFTASNAVITGSITASTGTIGGWTIGATTITATGLSLDSGNNRIRAYTGSNYVQMTAAGLVGYDTVLGTTVNIPTDGSAPEFSSGIIKEFEYQIYTSGVIKTAADPTATGGFLANNTRIAAYDDTPTKLFEVIFNGTDKGDFYAGDYDSSNPGLKYDHSAGTMDFRGTIAIESLNQLPSDENLIGYWSLDDGSGSVAIDNSGNAEGGTLINTPTWSDGLSGKCLSFDSNSDQYVSIPDDLVDVSAGCSVSLWIYLDETPSHALPRYFATVESGGDDFTILVENQDSSPNIAVLATTAYEKKGGSTLSFNTWYHVAATFSGSELKIYINAAEESLSSTSRSNSTISGIGVGTSTTSYCAHGKIDEIRLYSSVLTASEVKALYLNPSGNKSQTINIDSITESSNYGLVSQTVLDSNMVSVLRKSATANQRVDITASAVDFYSNNVKVMQLTNTPEIIVGQVAASQNNILISSGAMYLRNNTTNFISLTNAGVPTIELPISGQIILTGHATTPAKFVFNGTDDTEFYANVDGSMVYLSPTSTNAVGLNLGTPGNQFLTAGINGYTAAIQSYVDSDNSAKVTVEDSGGNSRVNLLSRVSGTNYILYLTGSVFRPATDNQIDLGTIDYRFGALYCQAAEFEGNVIPSADSSYTLGGAANYWATSYIDNANFSTSAKASAHKGADLGHPTTGAWDDCYADDFNNVADIPFLDDRNDLEFLMNMKGSGVYDERTGLEIIDDNTLPDFVKTMDKEGKKEILLDPDGKPYFTVKAMLGWHSGCMRQLKNNFDQHLRDYH